MINFIIGSLLLISSFVFAQNNQQLSKNCENELAKYSDCLNEIGKIKTEGMGIGETMISYCNTFKLEKCKNFVSNVNSANSNCISNEKENLDRVTAVSILTLKIAYLTYCATDKDGNTCPLSNYLLSNANILKQSYAYEPTREMLGNFKEDCRINECNKRLINLKNIIDKIKSILGNGLDITTDDPVNYEKYLDYYKINQCSDIDGSVENAAISLKIISYPFVLIIIAISTLLLY